MWKLCDLLSAEIGPKLCETRQHAAKAYLSLCKSVNGGELDTSVAE